MFSHLERPTQLLLGWRQALADKPETTSNQRNGKSGKTVLTEDGPLRIEVPRDLDVRSSRCSSSSTSAASPASTTRSLPCISCRWHASTARGDFEILTTGVK